MIRKLDIGLDNGADLGNQYGGSEYILSAFISNDIHALLYCSVIDNRGL